MPAALSVDKCRLRRVDVFHWIWAAPRYLARQEITAANNSAPTPGFVKADTFVARSRAKFDDIVCWVEHIATLVFEPRAGFAIRSVVFRLPRIIT